MPFNSALIFIRSTDHGVFQACPRLHRTTRTSRRTDSRSRRTDSRSSHTDSRSRTATRNNSRLRTDIHSSRSLPAVLSDLSDRSREVCYGL